MSIVSSLSDADYLTLKTIRAEGKAIHLCQVVVFRWQQPIGTRYYTCAPYDRIIDTVVPGTGTFSGAAQAFNPSGAPVTFETRLTQSGSGTDGFNAYITDLSFNVDVEDSKINIELSNADIGNGEGRYAIETAYLTTGGFGTPVEVFYYWPQIDWLQSRWFGYLDPIVSASSPVVKLTASRSTSTASLISSRRDIPGAAFYPVCIADFPFEYPELFANTDGTVNHSAIALNDCPYDPANGVGAFQSGSTPFATCDRSSTACAQRFPSNVSTRTLPYLGFDNIQQNDGLPFRQDSRTVDQTRGNSDNLAEPVRVIFGQRVVKSLDVVQTTVQVNVDHPERGSDSVTTIACEGPVVSISNVQFNNVPVDQAQLQTRLGTVRQQPTGFIPAVVTVNYSARVVILAVQKGDFRGAAASSISIRATITGLSNIRIYSDATTFSNGYTTNPAWCALEAFRNRRWGLGVDLTRMYIPDWVTISAWFNDQVSTFAANGTQITSQRATFNAEWRGRKAQDQIRDWALYRRVTLPFAFEGKLRVIALKAETLDSSVPLFTDRFEDKDTGDPIGTFRTILQGADGVSTCDYQEIDIDEQINEIVVKFDDATLDDMAERPLLFADLPAQRAAGRRAGDSSLMKIKKEHFLTGITSLGEAIRQGNILLDLGEFDEGGLKNPIRITFTASLLDCVTLHPYKIIKVDSYKLDRMVAVWGFQYFRILKMNQVGLTIKITAQAYPEAYYTALENNTVALGRPGGSITNPNGTPGGGIGTGGGGGGGGGGPTGRTSPLIITSPDDDDFGIFFILSKNDIPEDLGL